MKKIKSRKWQSGKTGAVLVLSVCSMLLILNGIRKNAAQLQYQLQQYLLRSAQAMYVPSLVWKEDSVSSEPGEWIRQKALAWIPVVQYVEDHAEYGSSLEDEETIAKILESQANDENAVDENGKLIGQPDEPQQPVSSEVAADQSIDKLRDFEYLLSNFYTVDSSTMIGAEQLNVDDLLGRNMKIGREGNEPKILIFHTHSQETFVDSVPGDISTGIVGIGQYLTELLNAKGIPTLHDFGVYDIINGKLDRSEAYENAEASIRPILEANPSIEVAIDLHRDGVAETTHLVTQINGKPTARIMYFNGLSRSRTNGDITYLYNPYIQDNLAFSLQMQLASERMYPGFVRHIYLKAYRYNLHLLPKSLLIEAGAQTNTVEEMKNAMEVLADTLCEVL
ncbi:MAG: stage II sporulation protein P [[Ruminococcus] lactaris]|uniref:stage II sporulation protein P n=1 Tax=[Ruminococcus] lactaris TaxID=46228 RepID=UPI0039A3D34A